MTHNGHIAEYVTVKIKARNLFKDWPRSPSTSSFAGSRIKESISGFQYRVMYLPWERVQQTGPFTDWRQEFIVDSSDFRRITEDALEREYHNGQAEMVDNFRASCRRLTETDLQWTRCIPGDGPLQRAMKKALYRQYMLHAPDIPVEFGIDY